MVITLTFQRNSNVNLPGNGFNNEVLFMDLSKAFDVYVCVWVFSKINNFYSKLHK